MIVSSAAFECEEVKGEGGVLAISLCPPPPLPLHPLHHLPAGIIRLLCAYILLSQWHAQQSPIVHPGTSPLCFAYVQFGGGD